MRRSLLGVACLFAAAAMLAGCPPSPLLRVSTETLRFGVTETLDYETVKTFEVWNGGSSDTTLVFTVTATRPWILLSVPSTTSTGPDDRVTVTVTIDRDFALKNFDFNEGRVIVQAGDMQEEIQVTTAPEYFTEFIVDGGGLGGLALNFLPSGGPSFYEQVNSPISDFPTPPGGQIIDFDVFSDPVRAGLLDGRTVPFYGVNYGTLWISSQGWISFGNSPGPLDVDTLGEHFAVPRISALPVDAAENGTVTYQQDAEKLTISYEDADTKGGGSGNDFQIELFFTGLVRMSFVDVDPTLDGIIGLSFGGFQGLQPNDFVSSDLSAANTAPLGSL